ncbi:MAG: Fe-S protein assembly co-chaperone HscB [Rickettsiales bacterium]
MINHFFNLNLEVKYELDLNLLEKNYLELQQKYHPDKSLSDLDKSIAINESYKILSNPISRAKHLLELQNIFLDDDQKSLKPDIEILKEIILLQENIEDCQNIEQLNGYQQSIDNQCADLILQFLKNYQNKNFEIAGQNIIKIKYLKKTSLIIKTKLNFIK